MQQFPHSNHQNLHLWDKNTVKPVQEINSAQKILLICFCSVGPNMGKSCPQCFKISVRFCLPVSLASSMTYDRFLLADANDL